MEAKPRDRWSGKRRVAMVLAAVGLAVPLSVLHAGGSIARAATTGLPTWQLYVPPFAYPSQRSEMSMATDSEGNQTLLFGGALYDSLQAKDVALGDTWTWSSGRWTERQPSTSPPARIDAAMADDPAHGDMVLFGGNTEPNPQALDDTWLWSHGSWVQAKPAHQPPPLTDARMAYDAASGDIVLFGGELLESSNTVPDTPTAVVYGGTWIWDGRDWTQAQPATSPSARDGMGMAQTPAGVLVFGGCDSRGVPLGDTWLWAGNAWQQLAPATSPAPRCRQALAFDATTGQTILAGGTTDGPALQDTWNWDGTTWTLLAAASLPQTRDGSLAGDPSSGGLVLFGGTGCSPSFTSNDTWTWDGRHWTEQPGDRPLVKAVAYATFDSDHNQAVVFAPGCGSVSDTDTWTFDGSVWTRHTPPVGPPPFAFGVMAYDPGLHRAVLVANASAPGVLVSQTWLWDGARWTASSSGSPPPRRVAAMGYDPASGTLLLFGGVSPDGSVLGDTWQLNGVVWKQLQPPTRPAPDAGGGMQVDARGHLVLLTSAGTTWTWNAATMTWQELTAVGPPPRGLFAMGYDPQTQMVLMFGGSEGLFCPCFDDTWGWTGTAWVLLNPGTSNDPLGIGTPETQLYPGELFPVSMSSGSSTVPVAMIGGDLSFPSCDCSGWLWGAPPPTP